MILQSRVLLILAFLVVSTYSAIGSACNKGLTFTMISPIDMNSSTGPQTITVNRITTNGYTSVDCPFVIYASNGDNPTATSAATRSLRNGSVYVPFQIYSDSGKTQIIKSRTEATSAGDALVGTLPNGQNSMTIYYYPAVLNAQTYKPGNYLNDFVFSIYCGSYPGNTCQNNPATRSVRYNYKEDERAELSLVDTGGSFVGTDVTQSMDFGNLVANAQQACDVLVSYNSGYTLSMSSPNSGRLKHSTGNYYVNYTLRLNGNIVTLTSSPDIKSQSASTTDTSPTGGLRLPLTVTIGSVVGAQPGSYSDVVTISVATMN